MDAERRLVVVGVVGLHRPDHAQIVDTAGHVRKELADFCARLAMTGELPLRAFEKHFEGALPPLKLRHRNRLAGIGDELRLGIPRLDVRHPATHVEKDHPLGPRREMRGPRGERIGRRGIRPARCHISGEQLAEQPRHEDRSGRHRTDQATATEIGGTAHGALGQAGVSVERGFNQPWLQSIWRNSFPARSVRSQAARASWSGLATPSAASASR